MMRSAPGDIRVPTAHNLLTGKGTVGGFDDLSCGSGSKDACRALAEQGFTLAELIIVIAMIAIVSSFALPPLLSWRNNLNSRGTATQMATMLRDGRSLAIANSFQYMVVFKPNSSSFQILKGTQAYNTPQSGWRQVVQKAYAAPKIALRSNPGGASTSNVYVQFNPNGTAKLSAPDGNASDPNIFVVDSAIIKYSVSASQTGRVTMKRLN
jgi:prepilin-type N-terminal cleavage/methylation domain-containing protein